MENSFRSNLIRQRQEHAEQYRIGKFWYYSKAWGVDEITQPDSLEDRLYTKEQEDFFAEYEVQILI